MIYAGDQWIQYPVKDLYDKAIMQMSIAAAKDMYEKGQKQLEDFNTKYGDFMSPIAKDMDWYNQNVTGKVRDTINNLYANGIDPLRSAEGRAAVAQLIYSMPTGDIAKLRQSAEAAKEYIKNRGRLQATGKWDPNFELFVNNGKSLEDWDTMSGGVWNRTSPSEIKTLKEITEDWYNQRQAHMLDKAGVESFGMKYDPRYNYKGFTDQDLLDIAAGQTPGWNGSIYADYYRDVARRKVQAIKNLSGDNSPVTSSEVEKQLQQDIAIANREYKIAPIKEADQFVLDDYRTRNDIRAHAANKAIDHKYWELEHPDDGDNKFRNIFREAEFYANNTAKNGKSHKVGDYARYLPGEQYDEWIDPVMQASERFITKDKDTGETWENFKFNPDDVERKGSMYVKWDDNTMHPLSIRHHYGEGRNNSYTFESSGHVRAEKTENGYLYYMSGRMKGDKYNLTDREVWIPIKEGMRRSMGRNKGK